MKGVFKKDPCLVTCVSVLRKRSFSVDYLSILKGYDIHGRDEGDLCDHPFKALETLVSLHLDLILYQKTCTRIESLLNSY